MTDRLKKKLRSSMGASITFALLLFLVCAVIGSVVLAAGTASSGRFSKLADSDARYYSVTSAAELIKNAVDGRTVKKTVENNSYVIETITHSSSDPRISSSTAPDTSVDPGPESVLYDIDPDDILYPAISNLGQVKTLKYTLSHTFSGEGSGVNPDTLAVNVTESIQDNGNIVFTISSGGEGEVFSAVLTFEAKKTEAVSNSTVENNMTISDYSGTSDEDYVEKVYKTVTEKTVTSVEWKLSDIRRSSGS